MNESPYEKPKRLTIEEIKAGVHEEIEAREINAIARALPYAEQLRSELFKGRFSVDKGDKTVAVKIWGPYVWALFLTERLTESGLRAALAGLFIDSGISVKNVSIGPFSVRVELWGLFS